MGTLLLVDDNISLARFTACHLRREFPGLEIELAASMEAARRSAQATLPDVLLVDQHLPDGDGIEFGAELARRHAALRVVLTSAALPSEIELRSRIGGTVYTLLKPFEVERLAAVVGAALGRATGGAGPGSQRSRGLPQGFDAHLVRNRLAALLAGIRAYSEELRHGASSENVVRQVVADYEQELVDTVQDLRRLLDVATSAQARAER